MRKSKRSWWAEGLVPVLYCSICARVSRHRMWNGVFPLPDIHPSLKLPTSNPREEEADNQKINSRVFRFKWNLFNFLKVLNALMKVDF